MPLFSRSAVLLLVVASSAATATTRIPTAAFLAPGGASSSSSSSLHRTATAAAAAPFATKALREISALRRSGRPTTTLFMSSSSTSDLPDADGMRAGEIKKELESYGISTRTFLEKSELVDALTRAREEGKTPRATTAGTAAATSATSTETETAEVGTESASEPKKKKKKRRTSVVVEDETDDSSSSSSSSEGAGKSRDDRVADAVSELRSTKASELRAELESRGISTKSFFEKSEFVRALAEARVDGVTKRSGGANGGGGGGGGGGGEGYAEYADVEVLTSDDAGPRKRSSE
eukprot:CAMPEP_0113574316 /NCGR_PEP_ID=MMETSP0015_2-20120614/27081_1 /TAXON_ID=2838 /ORGANISM="Odontella" /LENGTH=292 /DNA_ID=CAMNT_0000477443 /DNA_START=168 /DNA_END=1043 /DNA_ORIENTATION=+ /assembly_acc=CAM_ASM_000160